MGKAFTTTSLVALISAGVAVGQTCPLPPAECAGTLHCGGQWDFEAGFYFTPHMLAGKCAGPPGGGPISCVPSDKQAQVAVGWTHWAAFPDWPTPGYWGTVAFNENKNCDNVHRGNRSQELTMTCANGVGVIYKQAIVPANRHIRVEAYMRFTANSPSAPNVEHAIGVDPAGGTNPAAPGVQWTLWQQSGPTTWNRGVADTMSTGTVLTVFIRQRAFEPDCQGQTFMIDNVRVSDLGPVGPLIEATPVSLNVTGYVEADAPPQTLSVRNVGAQTLDYTLSANVPWIGFAPAAGSATTQTDAISVTFDTDTFAVGQYQAAISVTSSNAINSPQIVPVALTVKHKPGDPDGDGDVDQDDFGLFQRCFTGSGLPQTNGPCPDTDLDGDSDVDQDDFALFQRCISGPGVSSDPLCLN